MNYDVIDTFLYIYIYIFCILPLLFREIKDIQFSEIPKVVVLDGVTTNKNIKEKIIGEILLAHSNKYSEENVTGI